MKCMNGLLRYVCACAILLFGVATPGVAQKKVARATNAAPRVETAGLKMRKAMLPATAKVMFVDSVVVSKAGFLKRLPISRDAGTLSVRDGRKGRGGMPFTQYENEFGDRRVFADGDTAAVKLYAQTLLGTGWDDAQPLPGLDFGEYEDACYPFLASDGVTLYFAAKGPHSMGGYDLFMTTYDNDNARWYEPQNYGLPFNSTANDYLLAIDDVDTLGWLVTDRYQPADSVCIYTFVPTYPRKDFQADDIDEARLARYADIASIRDTWKFGDRKAALARQAATKAGGKAEDPTGGIRFVVNDRKVITSTSQFKKAESKRLYAQLQELEKLSGETERSLAELRGKYAKTPSSRQSLRADILKMEKELAQQEIDRKGLAKKIRNLENQ